MSPFNFVSGEVLLIDKPMGWTSFDVVNKIRGAIRHYLKEQGGDNALAARKLKVGHAGTLDPLATGMLIICTGKFTKKIDEYMAQEKEYTGTIQFGATTASYDSETPVEQIFSTDTLTDELIRETSKQFIGTIQQVPPMYSAIKQDGKKMYELAREGKTVEIKSREVTISAFDFTRIELPQIDFRIACSKGTYIRSIAHDLGKALNNGGYLSALRRTRIGEYKIEDAMTVDAFLALLK